MASGKNKNIELAIVWPNKNAYSETFVQAHRNIPHTNVHCLYGGLMPRMSEKEGRLAVFPSIFERIQNKIAGRKPEDIHAKGFKRYLQKHGIKAVLAEFGMTGAEVTPICKELNVPLFVHFHGLDASVSELLDKYQSRYQRMFDYASKVFSVSKAMHQKLLDLGCPPQKLCLNTYGPKDLFLNVSPTFSEPQAFVAIGRFVDKKAPYYPILAIRKVAKLYPEVKLYFAGTGPLLETCQNLVRVFKLEKNIKFLGTIEPEAYATLLSRVTGFVQHSITAANGDMEGTPLGVLEASAAGIPVIATKHAGIPDVILNNKTGYLVEEHDVDGMAQRMIELIGNHDLVRKLGHAGKKRIKESFSMTRHLSVIENVLREGVNERSKD